jgi:hypothetical protein
VQTTNRPHAETGSRRRSRIVLGSLTLSAFLAIGALTAGAANASAAPVVTGVTLTGDPSTPTITVTGTGFGNKAPKGYSAAITSCGDYNNNGDWYGKSGLWFGDNTHQWQAGLGKGTNGNCIGIVVESWKSTQVVFQFGSAYGTFDHWNADPGDNYVIALRGYYWGGVVSYS